MERNDNMRRQNRLADQIAAEAADWFARLHDPAAAETERDEFTQWLLRSPAHIEEYLAITRLWGDVGTVASAPLEEIIRQARAEGASDNVVSLNESQSARVASREAATNVQSASVRAARSGQYWLHALAAGVLLAAFSWFATEQWLDPSRLVTKVGEQRSVTLTDGSVVYVNTDSDIRIDLNERERRVVIARGEARFNVAKDAARPFIVTTRQATVRAVGTSFNVRTTDGRTAVTVIEGRVALSSRKSPRSEQTGDSPLADAVPGTRGAQTSLPAPDERRKRQANVELTAGQHAAITEEGTILPDVGPSVERALAWTERRLVFRDEALADVVAEFNRYHERPIRIADPELAALRISGSFYASDPRTLIQYLERYEQVRASEDVGQTVIQSRTAR